MPHSNQANPSQDEVFMRLALQQAAEAAAAGEVPVGAVVVRNGVVVGTGRNAPIQSHDPTAHAEIVALRAAAQQLANYRLDDCTLYVTLEPCAMCCGGILHGRLSRLVFGAADPKTGCAGSVLDLFDQPLLNHHTQVQGGVLAHEASSQLQQFFQSRRTQQRAQATPLREDALRTPPARFEALSDSEGHYCTDLPSLAGLRLHYMDLGPSDSPQVLLCLHPIPGWSHSYQALMPAWLEQGARVLLPDLIGFGRSDKPKRQSFHSLDWHVQCLIDFMDRLGLDRLTLVVPEAQHPLAALLLARAGQRIQGLVVQTVPYADTAAERAAMDAPYPDPGHRAAERAFASKALR